MTYVVVDDEPSLVWVANLAAITLHIWYSHVPTIDVPDVILFDLDPGERCPLARLAKVALAFRDELESVGIRAYVKTTGGMGLHVVLPLKPKYDYEVAKGVSELVARRIHAVLPKDTTLERTIARRPDDLVYLDWVQVGKGKTYVAPFTVRARDGAPVSMPLAWADVEAMRRKRAPETTAEMRRWTIANVPELVATSGDPWRREGLEAPGARKRLGTRSAALVTSGCARLSEEKAYFRSMAHAIWSGAINFGLVTIPVKLYTAVRSDDLRFNFLHKKDNGRIYNERHCSECGEKVEYADLVRGYEYEKGRYVTVTDDDLKAVRPEATQSVQIVEFVELDQINPMFFDTPYYLEPEKKAGTPTRCCATR